MFVSHNDLLWMLRQVDGQAVPRDRLVHKLSNHSLLSLFPYYDGIDALFAAVADKPGVVARTFQLLGTKLNCTIPVPGLPVDEISIPSLKSQLIPHIIEMINQQDCQALQPGARVAVRVDSGISSVQSGSEGFVREQLDGSSRVRFYSSAGRLGITMPAPEIADSELQLLNTAALLQRHGDLDSVADYFFNECLLQAMKTAIDSSVYACVARLAVQFLAEEGYLTISGDEVAGVHDRIFPAISPGLYRTYKDGSLFSSYNLSCPPSERKPHALRLELTTGCDYNNCTYCTEYSGMKAATKSLAEFKEHVDRVAASIGSEKARIRRLFLGSGNSLGVDTPLLLEALNYAGSVFSPQRISLYGRTTSILKKSVAELKQLKKAGLSLIYWGLESGSDEVLKYVRKDCTREQMIEAAARLAAAEIEVSAMLMPGVGGLRLSDEHVAGSLELLHNIDITYLTLLSINPGDDTPYARTMAAEMDNRHLTASEVNAQVYKMLEGLQPSGLRIGMFTEEVDQVSCNSMRFSYEFTASSKEILLRDFWN